MSRFLEALHSGRVLLMDGAMGTELRRAGLGDEECPERWNLTFPDRVRAVHTAYAGAGADVFLSHTFQANPAALSKRELKDRLPEIIRSALLHAKAAGPDRFLLGDMGPFGSRRSPEEAVWVATAFQHVDALLLETASDVDDLSAVLQALARAGRLAEVPVLFSWTFLRNGEGDLRTFMGRSPESCAHAARKSRGVAALGVNCGRDVGMDEVIEVVRRYRAVTDLPLFARPNAGTPTKVGGRWVYPLTPEAMAARLPELLAAGVGMVGGCCGTTPAHIAAFTPVVDDWNARRGLLCKLPTSSV